MYTQSDKSSVSPLDWRGYRRPVECGWRRVLEDFPLTRLEQQGLFTFLTETIEKWTKLATLNFSQWRTVISWEVSNEGFFHLDTKYSLLFRPNTVLPSSLHTTQVSKNSLQFWHYVSGVRCQIPPVREGLSPVRLHLLPVPVASPGPPILLTDWLSIKGSYDTLLRFNTLVEWVLKT